MKIFVGGVNGVGKSTLLREAAARANLAYIHAATCLMHQLGLDGDYERLRAFSQSQRDFAYAEYMEELFSTGIDSFLFDAHYLNIVRGQVSKVTGPWIKDFDHLVLVSAPFTEVWARVKFDASKRDRALFPITLIEDERVSMFKKYMDQTAIEFADLCQRYGKPGTEITNRQNQLESSVAGLLGLLRPHV